MAWTIPLTVRQPPRFYTLAFGISWGVGGIGLLLGALIPGLAFNSTNPLYYVAGYGPMIAAVILLRRAGGWSAVRARAKRLVPSARHVGWYLAAIVGIPAIMIAFASRGFGYRFPPIAPLSLLGLLPLTFVKDVGPQGEEFGWRGYALPDLLDRRSPLVAALILGVVWGCWHLPLFFIGTTTQSRLSVPVFFVNTVSLSILMTWAYLKTQGDLALMILIHLMGNFSAGVLAVPEVAGTAAEAAIASVILLSGGLSLRSRDLTVFSPSHDVAA
jgi:membrane protease YdiL (CAAX protease family)